MNDQILSENDTRLVYDILVKQLGITESQITLDSRIQEDLGADSLDIMEIIMSVEERFQITIPDEAAEKVKTVEDLLSKLAELISPSGRN
jgi:acyl carrier protein